MSSNTVAFNGAGASADAAVPDIERKITRRPGGWYTKLVVYYLKRNAKKIAARVQAKDAAEGAPHARAISAIRWAAVKSAVTGALAGAVSTGATLFTAETEGLGGIVAGPTAALAIGGELFYRTKLHVDLSVELAALFDVDIDPEDEGDLWRIYALTFGAHEHEAEEDDPGKELVGEITHVEGEHVGEEIGKKVLGESVMRNIIPVVGIVTSAVTNYLVTKKLGDTVRRYMRYQHALSTESSEVALRCQAHLDLLIEGIWFIFSADGKLTPEEAAFLGHMLKRLDPVSRHATIARFVEDELDWTERIKLHVPEGLRDSFMHLLEVAAAVDKEVGLPERKILRRAALALGREFSQQRLERMIRDFEETGVLSSAP